MAGIISNIVWNPWALTGNPLIFDGHGELCETHGFWQRCLPKTLGIHGFWNGLLHQSVETHWFWQGYLWHYTELGWILPRPLLNWIPWCPLLAKQIPWNKPIITPFLKLHAIDKYVQSMCKSKVSFFIPCLGSWKQTCHPNNATIAQVKELPHTADCLHHSCHSTISSQCTCS